MATTKKLNLPSLPGKFHLQRKVKGNFEDIALGKVHGYLDAEYEAMFNKDVKKILKEISECGSKVEADFSPR